MTGRPASDGDRAAAAWVAMRSLVTELYDRRGEVSAALDMSFVRAKALRQLARRPMTLRDLAAVIATDPPHTTVIVNDLERRGYVERRADPEDGRRKIVTVTAPGRRAAQTVERILDAPPPVLRTLPPADLDALARILTALLPAGQ